MAQNKPVSRADEVEDLLDAVKGLILPFIKSADDATSEIVSSSSSKHNSPSPSSPSTLVDLHPPRELATLFKPEFPTEPGQKEALMQMVQDVLKYSVNTWHPGFMDKLYASTNAVGVISELLLSVLNTNVHVYQVSPALTIIEKSTSKALASLYGLTGPYSGGIAQPGGSASNQSSMVIARNYLYPSTKTHGLEGKRFVLFTSAHGHYSLEKAAQMFGFGMNAVRAVGVDVDGKMRADELDRMITEAKEKGEIPFYVNATAGTTVLGSYDPIDELADVCEKHGKIWLHIDGSWGGPAIFSEKHRYKLKGSHRVNSIGVTPHKMLSVPMTSSFLLAQDIRQFQQAMTLPAGYLFHNSDEADLSPSDGLDGHNPHANGNGAAEERLEEFWDLADLTPQCGR